jgi:prepilin-type N-terminal cleavage/methylation domain-containing protein
MRNQGFTLIELLIVTTIVSVLAALAVPGLLRARQTSYEASAIGSVRAVADAQAAFAASCGGGGFAQTNADLARPPAAGGQPFVSPDLAQADVVPKSGYRITVRDNASASNRNVMAAAATCNASVAPSRAMYYVGSDPVNRGESGQRSFATDQSRTVYFNYGAAVPNPIPAGLTDFIQ